MTQALKRLGLYEARQFSLFLSIACEAVCQCNVLTQVKFYNKRLQAVSVTCAVLVYLETFLQFSLVTGSKQEGKGVMFPSRCTISNTEYFGITFIDLRFFVFAFYFKKEKSPVRKKSSFRLIHYYFSWFVILL